LIGRIYGKLKEDDKVPISEDVLKDIEDGTRKHVPRRLVALLIEALDASPAERLAILRAAGLNFLDDGIGNTGRQGEIFHRLYASVCCDEDAYKMMDSMLGDRRAEDLDDRELLHILSTVLSLTSEASLKPVTSKGTTAAIKVR
jgi:hypothetical protein